MEKLKRSIDVRVALGKFRLVLNQGYKLRQCNRSVVQYGFTVTEDVVALKARSLVNKYNLFSPFMSRYKSRDIIGATIPHRINGIRIKAYRLHLNGIKAQRRLTCFLTARNFRALFA